MDIFAAERPWPISHLVPRSPNDYTRCCSALQRTASAFDRAAWAAQLAPLVKLWDSLAASQPQMLHQAQPPAGAANAAPLDAFVAQEAAAARLLAAAVHGSLASLKQMLAGTAVLTPAVQVSCMNAFPRDLQLPCIQSNRAAHGSHAAACRLPTGSSMCDAQAGAGAS